MSLLCGCTNIDGRLILCRLHTKYFKQLADLPEEEGTEHLRYEDIDSLIVKLYEKCSEYDLSPLYRENKLNIPLTR